MFKPVYSASKPATEVNPQKQTQAGRQTSFGFKDLGSASASALRNARREFQLKKQLRRITTLCETQRSIIRKAENATPPPSPGHMFGHAAKPPD